MSLRYRTEGGVCLIMLITLLAVSNPHPTITSYDVEVPMSHIPQEERPSDPFPQRWKHDGHDHDHRKRKIVIDDQDM